MEGRCGSERLAAREKETILRRKIQSIPKQTYYPLYSPWIIELRFFVASPSAAACYGRRVRGRTLIHHQDVICCVAFGRFSLQRIAYTLQSALLGALHLTPCWYPGIAQNPQLSLPVNRFDGGFWKVLFIDTSGDFPYNYILKLIPRFLFRTEGGVRTRSVL